MISNQSRRTFLLGLGAGSLVLGLSLPSLTLAQEKKFGGHAQRNGIRDDPNVFVAIAANGTVTIMCHRSEMGQGVRTSVALTVADELEADWSRVTVAQAPGDEARYGNQNTIASRSMRHGFEPLRRAGAAARMMLEAAAAATWGVPADEVQARNHQVVHAKSGRTLGYGALAKSAAEQPVPAAPSVKLKQPGEFRYIGKGKIELVDGADIVTGRAQYGIDKRVDDLLYAVVARPPVLGGKVVSFDISAAEKVPGVVRVAAIKAPDAPFAFQPLGGVAVVATTTWAAIKGREQLKIQWDDGPNAGYNSTAYRAQLTAASHKPGKVVRNEGAFDDAITGAARRVTADYYLPHLAHAPMEPPAATARIVDGRCEVWAPSQDPQGARNLIAQLLGLPVEQVAVNVTLLGGGFGRKAMADFAAEAAQLSKAMDGRPVKVTWTREDDLVHDYFHTVSAEHLEAGLDASGKVTALLYRTTAPTIASLFATPDPQQQLPFELGMGVSDLPFAIANLRLENPPAAAHTRIGWFRGVSNVPHAFAVQSFVAELAAAAGRDPKDMLLELLGPPRKIDPDSIGAGNASESSKIHPIDVGRFRRVVETVAREAGWGRKLPKNRGLGLAVHRSELSYAAVVVEVEIGADDEVLVPRVDIAIDCGPQVNPERVRSQMEGSIIFGLSLAMLGEISFKEGRPEQTNFHQYQVTRMAQAPRDIRVHMVAADDFTQPLGGVGEPGVAPVAPALANAIFAATGLRIRSLPIGEVLRRPASGKVSP